MGRGADFPAMADTVRDAADEAIDRILLDIQLLGVRTGWGEPTAGKVRERVLASQDENVKRFVGALEGQRSLRPWGQILIGAGELVLGAFLTVTGLVLVVPGILGFTSRSEVARYLSDLSLGLASPALSDSLVIALGFGFALFLLLAALYTLRQASRNFRRSGLVPPAA